MTARDKLYAYAGTPAVLPASMLDEAFAAYHAEVIAERDAEIVQWLVKKAREFHVSSRKREREQGDTCAMLASKIARGAVRPDNLRMLPNAGFFEVDHTYTRQHHAETIRFFVEYVSTSPDGRSRAAHGWRTRDWDTGWEPTDSDDFTGWTDVTAVYPVGGENAQEATS